MLRRYVEQILSIYNYIDGVLVTNSRGYVEFYTNYRKDINKLKEKDVLGKHVLDVYPDLTEENSSILTVLRTGKPISNQKQTLKTFLGQSINAVNTTMPIKNKGVIIGAVDVSRYIDDEYERQNILLPLKDIKQQKKLYNLDDIVTCSESMEILKNKIKMIADTDSSVLIYGETGTGKELVAQSIHTSSRRKNGKFISQNCAAIPGNLLESILFGTTKGSYTGAENKPGLFEIANKGTLFLDEINSMEIGVQAKILKAIEEKKVTRIGGYEPIYTDVKIVTAVNEDPIGCIKNKQLREDLFYRLSVVQLNIPPLRNRPDDIMCLVDYFIKMNNEKMNREMFGIEEDVEKLFKTYNWPGNVRELKNIIEGAFNLSNARFIMKKDLPQYLLNSRVKYPIENFKLDLEIMGKGEFNLNKTMAQMEKTIIINAINCSKNLVEAARLLSITKQALNYKISKYNLKQ